MVDLRVDHLGHIMPYSQGMEIMGQRMTGVLESELPPLCGYLLFLEHADTSTITRQHGDKHFKIPRSDIRSKGIDVYETNRGGDVTFHGVGQLVGYPIVQLIPISGMESEHSYDLIGYLRALESALLHSCKEIGVADAHLIPGKTGVWVTRAGSSPKKLIAIGVGCSKGITRHVFALNIRTDLERFTKCILPCGLKGHGVTSLDRLLEAIPDDEIIQSIITRNIRKAFDKATGCSDLNIASYNSTEIPGECAHG